MKISRTENNRIAKNNTAGQTYRANNFAKNTVKTKQANVAFTGILADWFPSIFGSAEVKAAIKAARNNIETLKAAETEKIQKVQIKLRITQLENGNKSFPENTTKNNAAIEVFKSALKKFK